MKIKYYSSYLIFLIKMILVSSCSVFGESPSKEQRESYQSSPQFNKEKQLFQNPEPTPIWTGRSPVKILRDFFTPHGEKKPQMKLPEKPPPVEYLEEKSDALRFIWLGHSSLLIELDGVRILTDPMFSKYASPVPFIAKRFQAPAIALAEINNIDIVLISHDHYDHLDYATILHLKEKTKLFFVPLGVGAHLHSWGIPNDRIIELDWWQSQQYKQLQITCTPAQHFSGRGILDRNASLWSSWSVHGTNQSVFFGGDSGYGEHYKKIGDRLGPFDITFLENGAYNLNWKLVHQLPEQAVQAHFDLKGKAMVPIHWGMFDLGLHSWHEPIERVTREAQRKGVDIITPKLGELITAGKRDLFNDWWSELIESGT